MPILCVCVCTHAYPFSGAHVFMCVPGLCGMRGWQPRPAPPAPATPSSNIYCSSSQAPPWTQMQVVRGRGSRATDGADRPTPTAPRQVGLILLVFRQAKRPLSSVYPGPGPRASLPSVSLYPHAPTPFPPLPLQCPQVLKAVPDGLLSASVGLLQARNPEATRWGRQESWGQSYFSPEKCVETHTNT